MIYQFGEDNAITKIANGEIVLFQGDSITDCGRSRVNGADLGNGYALMAAAQFQRRYPELSATFFNRGVSGDRSQDLKERWEQDCLRLRPNWVSIYIGINDTWRRYDQGVETSAAEFAGHYRWLIETTISQTGAKLILVEPFVLPVPEDRKKWREDLDPKIQVVRELAREYRTLYVPLDGLFAQASSQVDPAYWAADGVHPSAAGHALIAEAWLKAVEAL